MIFIIGPGLVEGEVLYCRLLFILDTFIHLG